MQGEAPNGEGATDAQTDPEGQSRRLCGEVQPRAAVVQLTGGSVAAPPDGVHEPVASVLVTLNAAAPGHPPSSVAPQPPGVSVNDAHLLPLEQVASV
jgi:hypothetical protein